MNKIWFFCLTVVWLSLCGAVTQAAQNHTVPSEQDEKQIFPPLNGLVVPDPPEQGADGKSLDLIDDIAAPNGEILGYLANAPIPNIEKLNHKERQPTRFYWHTSPGGDFCHYRDFEGNHWYGWVAQERFHWVLYKADRFWWDDSYAGRWLYQDRGQWWWQDEHSPRQARLYLDGSYYSCDPNGIIVSADLGERPGAIVSGSGPFQGDFAPKGGHPFSHGHGGHPGGYFEGGRGHWPGRNQANPGGQHSVNP